MFVFFVVVVVAPQIHLLHRFPVYKLIENIFVLVGNGNWLVVDNYVVALKD
ncbi:MAG: hypothetical protein J6X32_10515 [Salinivirgaceae bacterium]|nr:hypothetical protein [Salinivirgaceae bacterium]